MKIKNTIALKKKNKYEEMRICDEYYFLILLAEKNLLNSFEKYFNEPRFQQKHRKFPGLNLLNKSFDFNLTNEGRNFWRNIEEELAHAPRFTLGALQKKR